MLHVASSGETCNWEYIVQPVGRNHILKVRPSNTFYAKEISQPLLYPIGRNEVRFERIDCLLLDLTNSCNIRCPFCYSSPRSESVKLTDFDYQVISALLHTLKERSRLQHIQVGCDFEPLLSDRFEAYARALQVFKGRKAPRLGVVTNGILLDPNKLKDCIDAFGNSFYIRVSLHGHRKETLESYIKGDIFDRIVNGIVDVRTAYPDVRIELCNVLTKLNCADIPGYLDCAFHSLKANVVHFRWPNLVPLSQGRRTKLELPQGEFSRLHDSLSNTDAYYVTALRYDVGYGEFSVSIRQKNAIWTAQFYSHLLKRGVRRVSDIGEKTWFRKPAASKG